MNSGVNDVDSKNDSKSSTSLRNESESKKFVQIAPESIGVIAESVGFSHIPDAVTKSLAEDASYRLRELIQNCIQILRHSKRQKLCHEDVNLALRWSDVPALYGQHPQLTDFEPVKDAGIFIPVDKTVDLCTDYKAIREVEVYSSPSISTQFLQSDSEDRIRLEVHSKYFKKVTQSLLSTSSCVLQVALNDLRENTRLQPLLPSFTLFLQNLAEYCNENAHIARRIPLILQALISNPHLSVEPQISSFLQLLQNLILTSEVSSFDQSSFMFVSSISQILYQLSLDNSVDQVFQALISVVADSNQHLTLQCKSLIGLRALGSEYVAAITCEQWKMLAEKYRQSSEESDDIFKQESLISALVDVLHHRMKLIEQDPDLLDEDIQTWRDCVELYRLAADIKDSSVLRIGRFSAAFCQKVNKSQVEKRGPQFNEFYWTLKNKQRPSPRAKWQFGGVQSGFFYTNRTNPVNPQQVFEISGGKRSRNIIFRVRNWRQRPAALLKQKSPLNNVCMTTVSLFSKLATPMLNPVSKLSPLSSTTFCRPDNLIL